MCKDLDLELEDLREEECDCEEQEIFSADEVAELIEAMMPKIEVNTEPCEGIELDVDEFARGIKEVSAICGKFSALKSVGLTSAEAIDVIVNEQNIAFNLQLNKDTAKSNLEVAKVQNVIQSQGQI